MIIELIDVHNANGMKEINLCIELHSTHILYDVDGDCAKELMGAIVGLNQLSQGEIFIDKVPLEEVLAKGNQVRTFGYIFDEGIMLANLSLFENLMLPLRWARPDISDKMAKQQAAEYMRELNLNIDIDKRPVAFSSGQLKLFSIIRTLVVEPKVLLIEDPYHLLSKFERQAVFKLLSRLKGRYPMLISSIDDDFLGDFATEVIKLEDFARCMD